MGFEIIIELEPSRNREKIASIASRILRLNCVDKVTVPDAPLGTPKVHALAIASFLEHLGLPAIAHFRLRDMNRLLFEQLIWATLYLQVRRVLFLRGDPPSIGRDVDEISSVEATNYVKSQPRLAGMEVGIYMSLRHPQDKVLERARKSKADFYIVNHFEPHNEQHHHVLSMLRRLGRVYAYLITAPSQALEDVSKMLGSSQKVRSLNELADWLEEYRTSGLDGVVLSAPGYLKSLVDELESLCGR